MSNQLTVSEMATLGRLERAIGQGLKSFVEVGNALLQIRDQRLYRDAHATFEDYCRTTWQLERAQAYRLIEAAEVTEDIKAGCEDREGECEDGIDLSPTGDKPPMPTSERQVRPLAALPREERASAWKEVVEKSPDRRPTSKVAQEVAAAREYQRNHPIPPPGSRKPSQARPSPPDGEPIEDALDQALVELLKLAGTHGHNNHSRSLAELIKKAKASIRPLISSWS